MPKTTLFSYEIIFNESVTIDGLSILKDIQYLSNTNDIVSFTIVNYGGMDKNLKF